MPLASGSRIGPYEVIAPLGAGGMGEVYRARDPRIGRDVAIKVLPASFASDPDRLARFEQEARAADEETELRRTDVFALGIVVAEMVSGSHPFQRATRVETMTAILNKDVALPESLRRGIALDVDLRSTFVHAGATRTTERTRRDGQPGRSIRAAARRS